MRRMKGVKNGNTTTRFRSNVLVMVVAVLRRLIAGLVGEKCSHDHAKVGGQTISRMRWNEAATLKFETRTELQPAA